MQVMTCVGNRTYTQLGYRYRLGSDFVYTPTPIRPLTEEEVALIRQGMLALWRGCKWCFWSVFRWLFGRTLKHDNVELCESQKRPSTIGWFPMTESKNEQSP